MVIKSGSSSLGNAGVHLLAQAGAMKRAFHHESTRKSGSLRAIRSHWIGEGWKKNGLLH